MTQQEAASLIAIAVAVLPNWQEKSLGATARAWSIIMPDVDYQTGKIAMIRIMREKRIPTIPLPGEILAVAKEIKGLEDDPPTAIEAWEEVKKKIDFYTEVKWSHTIVKKAVQAIGTRTICESEYDVSSKFMKIYESLLHRENEKNENQIAVKITNGEISLIRKNK